MANTTQRQTAIAAGGAHWDVGDHRLWESTDPGVVLYARRTLRLATDSAGRPVAAVTRYLAFDGTTTAPTGGAVTLTLLGVGPEGIAHQAALEDEWTRVLVSSGYGVEVGAGPRYLPLPIKDASLSAQVDAAEGTVAPDLEGTTLRFDLTKAGVSAWVAAINGAHAVSGTVRVSYSYPQLMPPATATAQMHGIRCYAVLAEHLTVAEDGELSGSAADVNAAWDELVRSGAIEVSFSGIPEAVAQGTREGLLGQVREYLFDSLFDLRAAAARTTYTFRWMRPADVPDFPLSISVGGWTWLTGSLESSMADLVSQLGPWAVHDVHPSVSVPVMVSVEKCELVETVVVSLDFGDVRPPEVMSFDSSGGNRQLLVSTDRPDQLSVSQLTRVNFTPPHWPVVSDAGTASSVFGLRSVDVFPSRYVRRLDVVLVLAKDGQYRDRWPSEDDSLTVNIRFEHPGLASAISSTAPVEPSAPATFSYPIPGGEPSGVCRLEAVGSVGGALVRVTGQVPPSDEAVFLLVEGSSVRYIDSTTLFPESDRLARQLRTSGGAVTVRRELPPESESNRHLSISLDVPVVPQTTQVSGWAAAMAMLVAARDQTAVTPSAVAEGAGLSLNTHYTWPQVRQAVAAWDLVESPFSEGGPAEWSTLLRRSGPVWLFRPHALHDGIVVAGLTGDGTREGTWVRVLEPWPVRVGNARTHPFDNLHRQFGSGSAERAVTVHR